MAGGNGDNYRLGTNPVYFAVLTMVLNEWYDFFYEHKGKCPSCGFFLIPHFGCIITRFTKRVCIKHGIKQKFCPVGQLSHKKLLVLFNINTLRNLFKFYRKRYEEKYDKWIKRNLDIQRKKSYFKIDD